MWLGKRLPQLTATADVGGERERAGVPIDGGVVACEPGKPQDHLEMRELNHVEGNVL